LHRYCAHWDLGPQFGRGKSTVWASYVLLAGGWLYASRQGRIQARDNLPTTGKFEGAGFGPGDFRHSGVCDTPPPAYDFLGQLRLRIATKKLHYHQQSAPLRRSQLSTEAGNRLISTPGAEKEGIVGRNACSGQLLGHVVTEGSGSLRSGGSDQPVSTETGSAGRSIALSVPVFFRWIG
jgi:hypothetical protein